MVGAVCPWKVPSKAGERLPKIRKPGDGCALTRGVLGGILGHGRAQSTPITTVTSLIRSDEHSRIPNLSSITSFVPQSWLCNGAIHQKYPFPGDAGG